jgi:hypothetical protein
MMVEHVPKTNGYGCCVNDHVRDECLGLLEEVERIILNPSFTRVGSILLGVFLVAGAAAPGLSRTEIVVRRDVESQGMSADEGQSRRYLRRLS